MKRFAVLGLLGATALATTMGCGASPEIDEPEEPIGEVELAASYSECVAACRNGQLAMEQFCQGLPDPRMRATCWVAAKAGVIACINWCNWHFVD